MTTRPAPLAARGGSGVRGVAPGHYRVAPTRSTVGFRVTSFGVVVVHGTLAVAEGDVEVAEGLARVRVDVDAASFTTGTRRRDVDVRGPRFLDAVHHPVLSWTGALADGAGRATGTLRVRDTETPVVADVVSVDAGRAVVVTARLTVDRAAAGIRGARAAVGRTVEVDVSLTLLRA
ncbi:YceI family protein [Pseudonocardia sp. N23]|uniref:YceI family protein n=1 Tax=Pseudonocardia sp. N23 TaxID=1987376 RepID=UPI000C037681|nr:YceI family protein [Pseudonocardia sp. N23]GAY10710.1 protein yceI precursor [Pseudonocardia sp. N23]